MLYKFLQKNCVLGLKLGIVAALLLYAPPVRAGDFQWTAIGPAGGQIYALAIDPTTPDTLYVGRYGGVSKSINGGDSWTPVNTGLTNTDVRALAIDPSTPTTFYAGTYGGVFKSTNGGGNWTAVNTGLTNRQVWALAINPATPDTVYAGTWGGGVFVITFKPVFLPIIIKN